MAKSAQGLFRPIYYKRKAPALCETYTISVRTWWNERVVAGAQLSDYSIGKEGVDWKGAGEWKDWVATRALHLDWMMWSGETTTLVLFSVIFNSLTGFKERNQKLAKLTKPTSRYELPYAQAVAAIRFRGPPQLLAM